MSQLDDTILDALTHVTFPKGFAQAEPAWVVTVDGVDYPLWQTDALVVGSGAAGLRAAVELKRRQQNVLIATAGLYMGTSACSGSDKQTLFTCSSLITVALVNTGMARRCTSSNSTFTINLEVRGPHEVARPASSWSV